MAVFAEACGAAPGDVAEELRPLLDFMRESIAACTPLNWFAIKAKEFADDSAYEAGDPEALRRTIRDALAALDADGN
jgi:hypothetical protein